MPSCASICRRRSPSSCSRPRRPLRCRRPPPRGRNPAKACSRARSASSVAAVSLHRWPDQSGLLAETSAVHRADGFAPPVKLLSWRIQSPPWAWGADMRRRDFIKVIGSTVAWPLAARAQAPARGQQKVPTIGFLGGGTAASVWSSWAAAYVRRLAELGGIEHRTIAIEYRWAEGRSDSFAEIAAEFVRLKVDVIVTGSIAVPALMQATSVIPIVIALGSDPVGSGQVASLARPGGNVTGLSLQYTELAGKRLELLREIMPQLRHLAVIANAGYADALLESRAIEKLAGTLGIDVTAPEIRRAQDITLAFETFKGGTQAVYVVGDPLVNFNLDRIIKSSSAARLPTLFNCRRLRQSRRLDILWSKFFGHVPARSRVHGQDSSR